MNFEIEKRILELTKEFYDRRNSIIRIAGSSDFDTCQIIYECGRMNDIFAQVKLLKEMQTKEKEPSKLCYN